MSGESINIKKLLDQYEDIDMGVRSMSSEPINIQELLDQYNDVDVRDCVMWKPFLAVAGVVLITAVGAICLDNDISEEKTPAPTPSITNKVTATQYKF
jgi:hypothetical protein